MEEIDISWILNNFENQGILTLKLHFKEFFWWRVDQKEGILRVEYTSERMKAENNYPGEGKKGKI